MKALGQKGFGLLGLLVMLAIIAAGGYWVWRQKVINSVPVSIPKVDISNWKTYRNDKYGFEFKYPKEYTVGLNTKGGFLPADPIFDLILYRLGEQKVREGIGIGIYSPTRLREIQSYVKSETTQWEKNDEVYRKDLVETQAGKVAVYGFSSLVGTYDFSYLPSDTAIVVFGGGNQINQILSTFRFIK